MAWLKENGVSVFVELCSQQDLPEAELFDFEKHKVRGDTGPYPWLLITIVRAKVDICVCLGGDGTYLQVSKIFPGPCPPVCAFALGSLGFLTIYEADSYRSVLSPIM